MKGIWIFANRLRLSLEASEFGCVMCVEFPTIFEGNKLYKKKQFKEALEMYDKVWDVQMMQHIWSVFSY